MAYQHTRILDLQEPGRDFLRRAYDAMELLKWYIHETTDTSIRARLPETMRSQPQVIMVRLLPDNKVEVQSKNPLRTQVIDFGKNKKNVELLLQTLDQTS